MREEKNLNNFPQIRKKIIEQMQKSDYQQAFQLLRPFLDYPGKISEENQWQDIFTLFREFTFHFAGEALSKQVDKIIQSPNNPTALFDLAYELNNLKLPGVAATLLAHANEIQPANEQILKELVVNLEELQLNQEACNILLASPKVLQTSPFCRYLLGFNSLMIGDLTKAQEILPSLKNSEDMDIKFMTNQLQSMISRAINVKNHSSLNNQDLRGWHMVLNGSILLHRSPFGLEDGMNGRYAYMSDNFSLCQEGIIRIREVLKAAQIDVPQVIPLPYRSSQILARATAEILGKPLKPWMYTEANPGLVVIYEWKEITSNDLINELSDHHPNQVLWVHASCWTDPFTYSPDLTTFLHQWCVSPWGEGRIFFNKKTKKSEKMPPNNSSVDVLASKIVSAKIDSNSLHDLPELLSFIKGIKKIQGEGIPGLFRSTGKRYIERIGSPVKSSYFY